MTNEYWSENLNVNNAHGTLNVHHYEAGSITAAAGHVLMSGTDIRDANNITVTLSNTSDVLGMRAEVYVSNYGSGAAQTAPTTYAAGGSVWTNTGAVTAGSHASGDNNFYVEKAKWLMVLGSASANEVSGCHCRVAWKTQ